LIKEKKEKERKKKKRKKKEKEKEIRETKNVVKLQRPLQSTHHSIDASIDAK
jgi:hypothetical protein